MEGGSTAEDPSLAWDPQPAVVPGRTSSSKHGPYPQTLIAGPSLPPMPPPAPPGGLPGADPGFHGGVAPTSSGQPVDWAHLQVQMQVLNQQNPALFAQMQQFFWSQNMLQMQQQQQMQAAAAAAAAAAQSYHAHHHHLQQQQGPATTSGEIQPPADIPGREGEYNLPGGAGVQQYVQVAPPQTGGLFIPPVSHVPPPHLGEERDSAQQSQTPRRSLAIPIVSPKVSLAISCETR